MNAAVHVKVQPSIEPLTVETAANHIKGLDDDDLSKVYTLIRAARRSAERYTGRALINQTLEYQIDGPPMARYVELPRPPLASLVSIKYYTASDTEMTFSTSNVVVDTRSTPGRVILSQGQLWPSDLRRHASMVFEYQAGYETPEDVPEDIREAILQTVTHWYENRESELIPPEACRILRTYRFKFF